MIYLLLVASHDTTSNLIASGMNVGRTPNRHLAFAFGPHFCLGNQLAELEATAAFGGLIERFDRIEFAVPRTEIVYRRHPSLRGPFSVPLRLSAT